MNTTLRNTVFLSILLLWAVLAQAAYPGGETALVTKLEGAVSRITATGKQPVEAFVKLKEGDQLALEGNARIQLVFFASKRQESWSGSGKLDITAQEGKGTGLPEPQVKILPEVLVRQIAKTPSLDSQGRAGVVRLRAIATPQVNVVTIEDPIEMVVEEFNQVAVQHKIDITFATMLRTFLRQDPDIIMVGEIRDAETAEYAVQAALTGHLVLSTLHTNDSPSTIVRLRELGVDKFLVNSTLVGVVAQRLARKVCQNCKVEEMLTADQIALLEIPMRGGRAPELKVARGEGCPRCRGTGLFGRTGIFEVLDVTDGIRRLVAEEADAAQITRQARSDGMRTLREVAVHKLAAGITSFSEVVRVTVQEESR